MPCCLDDPTHTANTHIYCTNTLTNLRLMRCVVTLSAVWSWLIGQHTHTQAHTQVKWRGTRTPTQFICVVDSIFSPSAVTFVGRSSVLLTWVKYISSLCSVYTLAWGGFGEVLKIWRWAWKLVLEYLKCPSVSLSLRLCGGLQHRGTYWSDFQGLSD